MRYFMLPLCILLACVLVTLPTRAQPKPVSIPDPNFLRDFAETRGFQLGRPVSPKVTPAGDAVLFLRSPPRSPELFLWEFDVASQRSRQLLAPQDLLKGGEETLSPEEKARRERMRLSARGFASFQLSPDGTLVLLPLSGRLFTFHRKTGQVRELPTGKGTLQDPKFSPDGKSVAYVLDHDVYVMELSSGRERRVTTGGTEDVSHGLAEFIAQEEMGRFSGYWWSPDSQRIVYQESDAREVETWFIPDFGNPGRQPTPQRYPRPGKADVKVRLGVLSVNGGPTTWIDWDRYRYPYLATVRWETGGPLTILVQTRSQQEMALLAVDPQTGRTTTLLLEKDPAWLNLDQDVPRWLANGSGFLWTSERAGARQLELRDPHGNLVRVIVPANAGYEELLSVDEKAKAVYYRGSPLATQVHVWRVPLAGGSATPVSQGPGVHTATFAKDHGILVLRQHGPWALPRYIVQRPDGSIIGELSSAAEEPPFITRTEYVRTKTTPPFDCRITRPRNFDAKQKYPVIVDVYGGPHHQHVMEAMHRDLLPQWYADHGFIVVAIDGRGTPRRGREWERSIRGNFAHPALDDQVAALKALGELVPQMDLGRVGIVGWSFGGYMSALAVLRRPDVFKAAVAGAPVVDWEDYDTHYTERYLGMPKDNPAGYKESNLLTYAAELKRPLMLVHGTADDNVFFSHSLKLANALFQHGKSFELVPLGGLTHMIRDPVVRIRLEERTLRFFQEHLR